MNIIAKNINEAIKQLNENAADHIDFQIGDNKTVIEYDLNDEENTIEWSYEKTSKNDNTVFNFHC